MIIKRLRTSWQIFQQLSIFLNKLKNQFLILFHNTEIAIQKNAAIPASAMLPAQGCLLFDGFFSKHNKMAFEFTDKNFEENVFDTEVLVVVLFWAKWMAPSKMMLPVMEALSDEYDGRALIGKLDRDEHPGIVSKYTIQNLPTILFFKHGEVANKEVGPRTKQELAARIEQHI